MRILGLIGRGNLRTLLIVGGAVAGRPTLESTLAGSLLVLAGSALHVLAKGCLTQNRALTTGGPYRWTRNPFYLANLAIDGGLCVIANRPALGLLFLGLWTVVYTATIRREERTLEELFGDAYGRYAARVPRLLPWRRPLPRAEAGPGFSFANRNLVEGTEYARVARILAAPLWIVVPSALWESVSRSSASVDGTLWAAVALAVMLILDALLVRFAQHKRIAASRGPSAL